ncbi:hypothetical protein SISNIDRAFT_482814 [Sistotremastrum niveocremeum HHB9708]|uniref:Uncharacterized protein n=1 Tax=Sistotremastrum niveocremeum HHB9708 TaxID=1314777 RepID=A0A164XRK6_9AGAM|nr:hypothetical protein SISNIDRAFT_482814 [Sistotremastrum niveocremeum HHB9708]
MKLTTFVLSALLASTAAAAWVKRQSITITQSEIDCVQAAETQETGNDSCTAGLEPGTVTDAQLEAINSCLLAKGVSQSEIDAVVLECDPGAIFDF